MFFGVWTRWKRRDVIPRPSTGNVDKKIPSPIGRRDVIHLSTSPYDFYDELKINKTAPCGEHDFEPCTNDALSQAMKTMNRTKTE